MADSRNAHVRGRRGAEREAQQKRVEKSQAAADAERVLNDPAMQRAFTSAREQLVEHIIAIPASGHAEDVELERELCRMLRATEGVKRLLVTTVQGEQLRLANFQRQKPEDKE